MPESNYTSDCAGCSGNIPAYLDYILDGNHFSALREVEEHLANCKVCLQEYADLLGIALREKMEPLMDLILEEKALSKDIDLLTEFNHHWWQLCSDLGDKTGIAQALSHLGMLSEVNGEVDKAFDFHHQAMEHTDTEQDYYAMMLSASALGRLYLSRGRQAEAQRYLKIFNKTAELLGDKDARAISLIQLGDFQKQSLSNASLIEVISSYRQAAAIGEDSGYTSGAEMARQRLAQLKENINLHVRRYLDRFVSGEKEKVQAADQFCRDFAEFIVDELAGVHDPAEAMEPEDYTTGEYDLSEIFPSAFNSFRKKKTKFDSLEFGPGQKEGLLLTRAVLIKIMRVIPELGLSYQQAEELARYLQEDLTREMAAKAEIQRDSR